MPVKIINGPTDNNEGVINVDDLAKMKNDFITETTMSRDGSSATVIKTHKCFLFKKQIDDLFVIFNSITDPILSINFALHLNPTNGCVSEPDISDSLTIVIEAAENNADRTPHNSVGEFVLIPAYANKILIEGGKDAFACCPSSFP